jgi:hypothetical protein
MYNLFKHEKSVPRDITTFIKNDTSYKKRREEMAIKYRERMTEFITQINTKKGYMVKDGLMDSIQLHPYTSKVGGDSLNMRTNFKTEKDRIEHSLMSNSIFESAPSPDPSKSFELRPRQKDKEIGDAKFRHKPRFTVERVMDSVNDNSFILGDDNLKSTISKTPMGRSKDKNKNNCSTIVRGSSKKSLNGSSFKIESELSPRSILPHLHEKTHFKAATTFTLAYPGSFYCPPAQKVKEAVRQVNSDKDRTSRRLMFNVFSDIENNLVKKKAQAQKSLQIQTISNIEDPLVDISKIAKEVLVDCHVLRRKTKDLQQVNFSI